MLRLNDGEKQKVAIRRPDMTKTTEGSGSCRDFLFYDKIPFMDNELKSEIQKIKERNRRVELDKAWEVSWTRRIFILTMTFIIASIWLYVIRETNIFLKAMVPTIGYLLSTLSIPQIKKMWMSKQ